MGVERILVLDLTAPTPDLTGIPGTRHVGSEGNGLRQRLTYDPDLTTVAAVLTAVAEQGQVRDLAIEEPDIEDVVRRIYSTSR